MWIFCDMWLYFFPPPEEPVIVEVPTLMIDEPPKEARPFVYFIAGGMGGVFSAIIGQPMDNVKTRLQTMTVKNPPMYTGTYDCAKKIFQNEGIRGLYSGIGITLSAVPPAYAVSFFGYGLGKSLQELAGAKNTELTAVNYFNAGGLSGIFTSVIMGPAERVKVLLQVQDARKNEPQVKYSIRCAPKYTSSSDVILKLYQEGGIKSIYRGTLLTLMRDVPGYGAFFMVYELLKLYMMEHMEDLPLSAHKTVLAGGCAGTVYWLVALPCDNVKSRYQSAPEFKYNGMRDIVKEMYLEKGISSLYTGLTSVLLRSFPSNAACFLGFEYTKNALLCFFK